MSGANARDNAAFALQVQRWLISRGHPITADSWAGPATALAFAQETGSPVPQVAQPAPAPPKHGLSALFPDTWIKVEGIMADPEASALGLRVISVFRSFAEQQKLYDQGRNGNPGPIVTGARPGASYHNVRRAVDLCPAELIRQPGWAPASPLWLRLGKLYERYGLRWGGRWSKPDNPHGEDSYCSHCNIDVGPRGATHFRESGECRLAGVPANDEHGPA